MSQGNSTEGGAQRAAVPGLGEQAKLAYDLASGYIISTVKDPAVREQLLADAKKHITELASLAAASTEHLTDAEKRQKLLDYAKSFANQAVTAVTDPAQRASLLDKLKATAVVLQEVVKDPAKRQEVHDQLAATTHKLLQAVTGAPAEGAAPAPAAAPEAAK